MVGFPPALDNECDSFGRDKRTSSTVRSESSQRALRDGQPARESSRGGTGEEKRCDTADESEAELSVEGRRWRRPKARDDGRATERLESERTPIEGELALGAV